MRFRQAQKYAAVSHGKHRRDGCRYVMRFLMRKAGPEKSMASAQYRIGPSGGARRLSLFLGHFRASFSRFRKTDGDRLLPRGDGSTFAAFAGFKRAALFAAKCRLHAFTRCGSVLTIAFFA